MCNTGTKFDTWYVDNLKHMIDTYSNLDYNCFEVIDCLKLGGVYDKYKCLNYLEMDKIYTLI